MSEIRIDASSLVDEIRVDASSVDELDIVVDGITTFNTADSTIDGLKDETSGGEVPDEDYNWFKQVYSSLVDGSVKSYIMGLINQMRLSQNPSDVNITALKSVTDGGDIPTDDYNWFKSVYTSLVDGSVKSWIMGLVNQLKALADRVGLIDDNAYLEQFKISVKHLNQYDWFNAAKTTGTGVTSVNTVENRIIMNPIAVSDNITIDLMEVRIAVGYAGGKMRLAIYEGKPFYPFSLIWQSEEILIETASLKQVPLNLTLYKNKCYWLCVLPNTSNVKLYSFQVYQVTPISGNDAISTSSNSNLYVNYPYGILPTNLEGYVLNAQYTYVTNISLRKA